MATNYEASIRKFIKKPPQAMYDIGVGPKTEWKTLGALYPGMRIFGCEPNPTIREKLQPHFPGPLLDVAIGEQEGRAELTYDPDDPKCSSLLGRKYSRRVNVQVWTLDFFDAFFAKPDDILLWMDIEGSELAAIRGGSALLSSGRVKWINLEERVPGQPTVPGWPTAIAIQRELAGYGYRKQCVYNLHKTHRDAIYTL